MSYNAPETPLVALNTQDEVGSVIPGALVAFPSSDVNFADDEKANAWLKEHVLGLLRYTRDDSTAQHEEWGRIRRMASMVRDNTAGYQGMSNAYLPIYQKALETRVSHTGRGLFPTDTYLDAEAVNPEFEAATPAAKAWMMHQMESSAKVRAEMKSFLRSLHNYGLAVAKVFWERKPKAAKPRNARMTRLPGIKDLLYTYGEAQPWTCEGLRFKPRSVFSWYVWPTTINSIEEASLVFEDIQVSKQYTMEMGRLGHWKNVEAVLQSTTTDADRPAMQEQLDEIRSSANTATSTKLGDLATWNMITECWLRMPVPDALYVGDEEKGSAVPVKVIFAGGEVVEVRRNPFWHQKPPYLMIRMNENTDSFYTIGMGRTMEGLQQLANDFINQTNDNATYGLNPVVKINPNVMIGPPEPLSPGKTYAMTDPNGMVFDRPPIEQMQYGLNLTNQIISYCNDFSGAPSVLQGSGAKGGAKTATGSQILQGNVKGELQDLVEDIELRVMMPLMEMTHSLGQQYESAERYFAISGGEKVQFTREALEGEFNWKWVASSQASNQQMRAQNSIQFAQLAASMVPLLQQQGKMFNPEPLLRQVWESGLGNRNFDKLITQAPPPMMPGMAGPGGMPEEAGPEMEGVQEPRSAVEQAPGGSAGMVPGEGEAFGEVRQQADMMAGMMGASPGQENE